MTENEPRTWVVLINDEEQYGLFPAELPVPGGWSATGFRGAEDECVKYVDEHWTDMRPKSLRVAMAQENR